MKAWDIVDIDDGLLEVKKLQPVILTHLNEIISSYHGWCESDEYFDILAGEWVDFFCHSIVISMQEIRNGINVSKPYPIKVCSDYVDYTQHRVFNKNYYQNLIATVSWLIRGNSPKNLKFEQESIEIKIGTKERVLEKLVKLIGVINPKVLIVMPYYKCTNFEFVRILAKWRGWARYDNLNYQYTNVVKIDSESRIRFSLAVQNEIEPSTIEGVAKMMLPLFLPAVIFEDLETFRSYTKKIKIKRPQLIYSANALHGHIVFKQLFAEWKKRGSKLLYHQHGGGYGVDYINAFEEYESRVSDLFMSWGWTKKSSNIKPVTPAAIPRLASRNQNAILLICGDYPVIPIRMHYQPMPGSIEKMHAMTTKFLEEISKWSNIWIKPYPIEYGWGQTLKLKKAAPKALNMSGVPNFKLYAESKVVIHNYLGTSYLETLYLNIPTICLIDSQAYRFRDDAEVLFSELVKNKIIFFSSAEASSFLVELLDKGQLELWWNSFKTQKIRSKFVERYANFSKDWAENLENVFISELL